MSGAISVHHGPFGRAALYQLDKPMITHVHREAHLIFHVDGGRGLVNIGNDTVTVDAKTVAAVSPWETHSFSLVDSDSACMCLVLFIKPEWFFKHSQVNNRPLNFGRHAIEADETISLWASQLTSLLLENESSDNFDDFLYQTTQACFDRAWQGCDATELTEAARSKFIDFRVRRSLQLMKESFTEETDIAWLARQSGLSRPHFFKLFKKQLGITPNLYLNTLRSEQAINELVLTKKTVTDIGYDLGFSSQASFTRFFSSNVGIPPSDYRRVANTTEPKVH